MLFGTGGNLDFFVNKFPKVDFSYYIKKCFALLLRKLKCKCDIPTTKKYNFVFVKNSEINLIKKLVYGKINT